MTGCHKNVCFDDESYCFFLAFLTVGKWCMEFTFYQQIQTWGSISLSLHVTNFLIESRHGNPTIK